MTLLIERPTRTKSRGVFGKGEGVVEVAMELVVVGGAQGRPELVVAFSVKEKAWWRW